MFLDKMVPKFKEIKTIDAFIMIMTGDRLENEKLIYNMRLYENLLGGNEAWKNCFIVVSKKDFNPFEHDGIEDWEEELKE